MKLYRSNILNDNRKSVWFILQLRVLRTNCNVAHNAQQHMA